MRQSGRNLAAVAAATDTNRLMLMHAVLRQIELRLVLVPTTDLEGFETDGAEAGGDSGDGRTGSGTTGDSCGRSGDSCGTNGVGRSRVASSGGITHSNGCCCCAVAQGRLVLYKRVKGDIWGLTRRCQRRV